MQHNDTPQSPNSREETSVNKPNQMLPVTPPTSRLEEALRFWEMTLQCMEWMIRTTSEAPPNRAKMRGVYAGWRYFRDFLLNHRLGDEFPTERFFDREIAVHTDSLPTAILPAAIAEWTANSRRIFSVGGQLHRELALTSLRNFKLREIHWPFDTFVMALEEPLFLSDASGAFDCVLVTRKTPLRFLQGGAAKNTKLWLQVHFFSQQLAGLPSLSADTVSRINKLLEKREWKKAKELAAAAEDALLSGRDKSLHQVLEIGGDESRGDDLLEELITGIDAEWVTTPQGAAAEGTARSRVQMTQVVLRIVFGFALYMMSLPGGSTHRRRAPSRPGTETPKLGPIHHGADICLVTSDSVLSSEEHEAIGGGTGRTITELAPHFRRPHFRKRPGTAADPLAPKCVRVGMARVNFHKLVPGSLPGGLEQRLE